MKRVLVTGGTGFIGSHTCIALLEKGLELVILDSFSNSSKLVIDKIKQLFLKKNIDIQNRISLFQGDIRNKKIVRSIFELSIKEKKPIDAVMHFAGLKAIGESVIDPIRYWEVNVGGALTLFSAMLEYGCSTIIFSSSASIYNPKLNSLFNEESEILATNPYGGTKEAIEKILFDIFKSRKDKSWRIINLRYFNPVGAHSSGLIGEDPLGKPNNLFPLITQVASGRRKHLNIFGKDWPTLDGTCIRDYIHIMDLSRAHQLALDFAESKKRLFINLNIGTGKGTSIFELIKIFENTNNIKIPYKISPRRDGDVAKLVANNSKAKTVLNWEPKLSLEQICRDSFEWIKKNPYGYRI